MLEVSKKFNDGCERSESEGINVVTDITVIGAYLHVTVQNIPHQRDVINQSLKCQNERTLMRFVNSEGHFNGDLTHLDGTIMYLGGEPKGSGTNAFDGPYRVNQREVRDLLFEFTADDSWSRKPLNSMPKCRVHNLIMCWDNVDVCKMDSEWTE